MATKLEIAAIEARLDANDQRTQVIEDNLKANTEATQQIAETPLA
jgi:hypothetical protein